MPLSPRIFSVGSSVLFCLSGMMCNTSSAEPEAPLAVTPGEFLNDIPYDTYIQFDKNAPADPVFNVRDFGAIGDGKSINSAAINKAIEVAHEQGGGTVWIEGGDFVSGTILLKSNVTLRIARGSILRASRERAHFAPLHFICCENATNVRIEGPGKILGEGDAWWSPPRVQPPLTPPDVFNLEETMSLHGDAKRHKLPNRPSPLIRFRETTDVQVKNLIVENSPGWTLMLDLCDRVRVEGVVLNNNYHGENTDGIDVVGSSNVEITRCFISTGDDGIVLKNGSAGEASRAMKNVRISQCEVRSSANCIKIGTETWADISDVHISDCRVFTDGIWPWALSGIAIESVDGSRVANITVQKITAQNVMAPVFIRLGNRNRWKTKDRQGVLENISVRKLTGVNAEFPCVVSGIPGLYVKDVTLEDIDIAYRDAGERLNIKEPVPELEDKYPEFAMFGDLPAFALFARHVNGLTIRNFHVVPRSVNRREPFVYEDVFNLNTDPLHQTNGLHGR